MEQLCPACGARREPPPARKDHPHPALAPVRPEDYPHLKGAFAAWSLGDWPRMMGQCLVALGVERPLVSKRPRGPGWAFVEDSAAIYVSIDNEQKTVHVESPILTVPATRAVSLLRSLLDLNAGAIGLARFYLRRDRVIIGYSDGLANVSPPKLVLAIRDVALRADQLDDALAIAFDAEMVGPLAQRANLDWSFVGEPIPLTLPEVEMEAPIPLPLDALVERPPDEQEALYASVHGAALDLGLDIDDLPPAGGPSDDAAPLVAFLETALALIRSMHYAADQALIERATVSHAYERFRESHPDAVNLLLARAQVMLAVGWGKSESGVGGVLARLAGASGDGSETVRPYLSFVMKELVDKHGQVGPQPAVALAPLPSGPESRALLQRLASLAGMLPEAAAVRHYVYTGLFLDVIARFSFTEKTKDRLREELAKHPTATDEAAHRFAQLMERLTA